MCFPRVVSSRLHSSPRLRCVSSSDTGPAIARVHLTRLCPLTPDSTFLYRLRCASVDRSIETCMERGHFGLLSSDVRGLPLGRSGPCSMDHDHGLIDAKPAIVAPGTPHTEDWTKCSMPIPNLRAEDWLDVADALSAQPRIEVT